MKIAFLTEMAWKGKINSDHNNMRTEFAWMCALNADHFNISEYQNVKDYDIVILLFPQGNVMVDCHGVELPLRKPNVLSTLLQYPIVENLKKSNKKVGHMQEGPTWLFNEYDIETQFNYYAQLNNCDFLLAHNEIDVNWYKGLFPNTPVHVMPSLIIETLLKQPTLDSKEDTIIGGNFSRWYGGFQSFIVAQEFNTNIWVQDSHSKRTNEDSIYNLNHLPRLSWIDWMNKLSTFKYAIHLMPTVAAGTFSLNCAYYGIPCIGNIRLDTQRLCYPELSVDVDDIIAARKLAIKLKNDESFYDACSRRAKENYRKFYDIKTWYNTIENIFINTLK